MHYFKTSISAQRSVKTCVQTRIQIHTTNASYMTKIALIEHLQILKRKHNGFRGSMQRKKTLFINVLASICICMTFLAPKLPKRNTIYHSPSRYQPGMCNMYFNFMPPCIEKNPLKYKIIKIHDLPPRSK